MAINPMWRLSPYRMRWASRGVASSIESGGIPSGFDKSGLTLLVPASLADDANEILNSELTDEELAAQAEAAGGEAEP